MEKKLYKSSTDKVLAGVCGGIGEYFAVDTVIVRLLWVVFTLIGGAGLIAYIIAAIIVPERNSGHPIEDSYTGSDEHSAEAKNRNGGGALALGIILVLFGAFVLVKDFLPWIPRDMFLAAFLIGLGIYFIIKKSR